MLSEPQVWRAEKKINEAQYKLGNVTILSVIHNKTAYVIHTLLK